MDFFITIAFAVACGIIIAQNPVLIFFGLLGALIIVIMPFVLPFLLEIGHQIRENPVDAIVPWIFLYFIIRWFYHVHTYNNNNITFKSIKYAFHWKDIKRLFNYSK